MQRLCPSPSSLPAQLHPLRSSTLTNSIKMAGFVNRENRVPYYQRLFQRHDGLRQWQKTSRSRAILIPYYTLLWGGFGASMYMMTRQVLGKKTWF